ncbi:hypothetical protein [Streptomyces sp. NPDC050738]|uniref:hypothetical protein n=1 Tax=Streptomyces sp. NPDC050738 TaxID=3154744 RepID=UPI0034218A89
MYMITAAAAADSSTPTGTLIFLGVLGLAAVCWGGRSAFDVRGAVGVMMARRRAALQLRAQQTGNLGLVETDWAGPWYFRLVGSVVALAGLVILLLVAILATT